MLARFIVDEICPKEDINTIKLSKDDIICIIVTLY